MPVPFPLLRRAARLALLLTLVGLAAVPAAEARSSRAVLAFLPAGGESNPPPVLDRLDARPQLSLGLVSATQGRFTPQQALLDISAGSRTSRSVYEPRGLPDLELVAAGNGGGFIFGWSKALQRADTALAEIRPGLLASRIPGGAAFAGVKGRGNLEAVAAADRDGDIAALSLGPAADLADRVHGLLERHRFVVAGLPTAAKGDAVLDALLADRGPGDLLIVMQTPPRSSRLRLLPAGMAQSETAVGMLASPTTRLDGIVAAIDLPVTILRALHLPVPKAVKGQPIGTEGARDAAALRRLEARLRVVGGRRTPTIFALLFAWATLTLALGVLYDRRGIRAGLRIGGLAMLWVLPMLLLTGWLAPTRSVEIITIVAGCFALGALSDRFVPWPRAPLVPAAVAVVTYGTDLVFGSQLIIRSLLGPNPRSGSRFYGLGNELESTLIILLLVGLGVALTRRADLEGPRASFGAGPGRSRRSAAIVAAAGLVASVFVGAGQLGADVGGVITFGAGIAAMTVLLLPGKPSRRVIGLAVLTPVVALAGLAALDLVTGGDGHFTRTVLQADGPGALWDIVARRYTLAFNVLKAGAMPFITVLTVLSIAYAVRHRERIYAPLRGSPVWRAVLAGGLAASIGGALSNDSGPVLLVLGTFMLACVTAYMRGAPPSTGEGL